MKYMYIVMMSLMVSGLHAADNLKLCAYDPDQVMAQSNERTDMVNVVDVEYQKLFDSIKKEEELLRESITKFQNKSSLLSESARENEQSILMRQKRDLDAKAERSLEDYKAERQKVEIRFIKRLEEKVGAFANENGFDLIIPKGPGIYVSALRADKTSVIIEYMNKKYETSKSKTKNFLKA